MPNLPISREWRFIVAPSAIWRKPWFAGISRVYPRPEVYPRPRVPNPRGRHEGRERMKFETTRIPRHRSLSVKLMAVLALVVVGAFATVGYLTLRAHSQQSIALVAQNLDTLADTVRASTRYHMLRAAHQDAAEIVRTIGRQQEVEHDRGVPALEPAPQPGGPVGARSSV